ncbi:MAG: adenylate/guanylate cyclase domain-containing protein [Betaproteobacteria bacterium]|nr:adenylate/guanylate cyclase domain-containing protein [Betaproteobacteria bacterium]MDH5221784.1 adenylate/guanylate cyclase domain-containing protein [Betaproteobacteria bacterium]MDH5351489.1 adenylate/guanylate cyclase domain-containing protein [Betaproteobacteria bacterium]
MTNRILAILFADVSGSTALYEKLGDRRALKAVESVLDELRAATAALGGRVVKTLGDEIMAVFPTAAAAAQAATGMQERVSGMKVLGGLRLAVRIGFHAGPVLEEGSDFFGDAVNTAARMATVAKSGQIITTEATAQALPAPILERTRDLDRLPVKGKQGALRLFELLWRDDEDLTVLGTQQRMLDTGGRILHLQHADRALVMDADLTTVLIGRDAASDIVIAHRSASRLHGRIERRRDNYFYTDLSTNGTYVTVAGDAEIHLRRDEIMLRGRGRLAYGQPGGDPRAETVLYFLE